MPLDFVGSIICHHNIRWQHLHQIKYGLFFPHNFLFLTSEDASAYICDHRCNIKADGALSASYKHFTQIISLKS